MLSSFGGVGKAISLGSAIQALGGFHRRARREIAERPEDVPVTIPRGIHTGTRLRLKGKGRPGPLGTRGDFYLTVEIIN
jgi:hypothetical protein